MRMHPHNYQQRIGLCVLVAGLLTASIYTGRQQLVGLRVNGTFDSSKPQCGHWAVGRGCELLGIPVKMSAIVRAMPTNPGGHSLLQLKNLLSECGVSVSPRQETFESFLNGSFPCIAHLQSPDHFVIVSGAGEFGVNLFDCYGRRSTWSTADFIKRWNGVAMWLKRDEPPGKSEARRAGGTITFDKYFCDIGSIPLTGKPTEFSYCFSNTGTTDLMVTGVRTDCICLEVAHPEEALAPGASGEIKVVYRPSEQVGPFYRTIEVQSSDPANPAVFLRAAGYGDTGVVVVPTSRNLGDVRLGENVQLFFFVKNGSEQSHIKVRGASLSEHQARVVIIPPHARLLKSYMQNVGLPNDEMAQLGPRTAGLSVEFSPTSVGDIDDVLRINTNIRGFEELQVPIRGRVVEAFRSSPGQLSLAASAGSVSERLRIEVPADVQMECTVEAGFEGSDDIGRFLQVTPVTESSLGEIWVKVISTDQWPPTSDCEASIGIRVKGKLSKEKVYELAIPISVWH